ncbi:hypothetical protein ABZ922_37160 [Streptomyces shenzhenensis]|uniref:hypothetical protein n=1 Tax=Streptomyces shenzhenensis TaxID=943815 RepID=UPI0033EF5B04
MHRTTTAAALLVTVAISALSGCVTVQHPPTAGPPGAASARPSALRPDGSAEPRVVQAPAREALEMVGPSRRPERKRPAASGAPPAARQSPSPRAHPHREPAARPSADAPEGSRPAPVPPDVCTLGRRYGGWHPDSPESRICEQTYGR